MEEGNREWRVLERTSKERFRRLNDRVDLEVYNGSGERRVAELRLPVRAEREYEI